MSGANQSRSGESGGSLQTRGKLRRESASEAVLFSFDGSDGSTPLAGLTNVGGTLYGNTYFGGTGSGTVFKITTSGSETVVHAFGGPKDGAQPTYAGLVKVGGSLYGTTAAGGKYGYGTVFKITSAGKERVLYSFKGPWSGPDGARPVAGLVDVNGTLYGTTSYGGTGCPPSENATGCGTVFKITTSGTETVLYSFTGGSDGYDPQAALTDVNGTLYGTTVLGGCTPSCAGWGTVFKVTTSGTENVLYSFAGAPDGGNPQAGLTNVNGTLFGTTSAGGSYRYCSGGDGCGTVFKITTSGAETVLHSFTGGLSGPDGAVPWVGLLNVSGTLYGTTEYGGTGGYGVVYSITKSGKETVVHTFQGTPGYGPDGAYSFGDLTNVNGTLYGTTDAGGTNGDGTVFSLSL